MQPQFNEVDANYLMIYYSRLTPAFDRSSETIQRRRRSAVARLSLGELQDRRDDSWSRAGYGGAGWKPQRVEACA